MTADEARLLYAYNRWANERVLQAVSALSEDQLRRDLSSSFRSVWQTLVHVAWGEWLWLGRWLEWALGAGSDPRGCPDLQTLRDRWAALMDEQQNFLGRLTDARLEQHLSYENPPGVSWTYTLGQMLQHVVNHSTYHRGQWSEDQVGAGLHGGALARMRSTSWSWPR